MSRRVPSRPFQRQEPCRSPQRPIAGGLRLADREQRQRIIRNTAPSMLDARPCTVGREACGGAHSVRRRAGLSNSRTSQESAVHPGNVQQRRAGRAAATGVPGDGDVGEIEARERNAGDGDVRAAMVPVKNRLLAGGRTERAQHACSWLAQAPRVGQIEQREQEQQFHHCRGRMVADAVGEQKQHFHAVGRRLPQLARPEAKPARPVCHLAT